MKNFQKNELLLLGLILVAAFLLRGWQLEADAPLDLTFSNSPVTDPGLRSFDARNLALFGRLTTFESEESPSYMMSPTFTFLSFLSFSFLGIGYAQIRILSVVFGTLSVLFLFLLAKQVSGKNVALLSSFFLAFSYSAVMFDKFAFLETFVISFLILSLLLWVKGNNSRLPLLFRLGSLLSFILAFLFKPLAILFLPTLVVAFFLSRRLAKNKPSYLEGISLASLLLLFLAFAYFLLPIFFDLSGTTVGARFFATPLELVRGIALFFANSFLAQSIVLAFLSLVGIMITFRDFLHDWFGARPGLLLASAWLLSSAIPLAGLSYQPPRFFLMMLPPMCLLASITLLRFLGTEVFSESVFLKKRVFALFIIWLGIFSLALSIWINKFFLQIEELSALIFFIAVFAGAIFFIGLIASFVLHFLFPKVLIGISTRKAIFLAVILLFLASTALPFYAWASSPTFSLIGATRSLSQDLPSDSIVLGFSGSWLCMETSLKCIPLFKGFNDESPLEKFEPTHLLVTKGIDDLVFEENYGQWQERTVFVKTYIVGKDRVELYTLK